MAIVNDRIPTQPNRKKITNESTGAVEYAIVEYADNPTVAGTPINKALFDQVQFWDIQENEIPKFQQFYIQSSPGGSNVIDCLFGTSKGTLFAIDGRILYRSINFGESWETITLPTQISTSFLWYQNSFFEHGGRIVAGANDGNVIYSDDDGVTWNRAYTGASNDLTSVIYFNNKWFFGSESGYVYSSSDLTLWDNHEFPGMSTSTMFTVAGTNAIIAFTGFCREYYLSSDGINWSARKEIIAKNSNIFEPQACYYNNKWIALYSVDNSDSTATEIYAYISEDGEQWESNLVGTYPKTGQKAYMIADSDGLFVGISGSSEVVPCTQKYESVDGIAWNSISPDPVSAGYGLFTSLVAICQVGDRAYLCSNVYSSLLFSTLETKKRNITTKNNEEEIIGGECSINTGSYTSTGEAQTLIFDFNPKVVFLSTLFKNDILVAPYTGASGSDYSIKYMWGEKSIIIDGYASAGSVVDYVAIG